MFKKVRALMAALLLLSLPLAASAADPFYNFVATSQGRVSIPLCYSTEQMMKAFGEDNSTINSATDLFVDSHDNLYILDSGNSRVLKYRLEDGQTIYDRTYSLTGEIQTKNPNGIFADDDGDLYIADTDNNRVLHIGENGQFVEQFVQPDSDLYDDSIAFRPYKVGIDSLGQVYILNYQDDNGFIILDAYNQFKGYTASNAVAADTLVDKFIEMFATEEQKEKLGKKNRPMHSNFTFASDNTFYVTTASASSAQLKKFSSVGVNIYPKTDDFSVKARGDNSEEACSFVDVCVDEDGNASILDKTTGYITQYSADGIMLAVFGGKGDCAGRFMNPVAMAQDSTGRIYVLDQDTSTVQVLKPTGFIEKIHEALKLYNDGRYEESLEPWAEVLKIADVYPVANIGIGKAYMKQEQWSDAMAAYRKNRSADLYSEAFDQMRLEVIRDYFGWVVLAIVAAVVLVVLLVYKLHKYAIKIGGGR